MNEHGLKAENLLRTLPTVLQSDPSMAALAASIAEKLAVRPEEIRGLMIYTRIDELPESLLDILAHDFKVDWWNPEYSLEEKRNTLRGSWHVHRKLGTKYAVATAISAIYKDVTVQEWWEYGGKPFEFRINISGEEQISIDKHRQVLERIIYYKNLRSVLDVIRYIIDTIQFRNSLGPLTTQNLHFNASFFNSPCGEIILLNGRRSLDGAWLLNQAFGGPRFVKAEFLFLLSEREKINVNHIAVGRITTHNEERAKLKATCAATAVSNTHRFEHGRMSWLVSAKQTSGLSGTLTKDSMWRLEGLTPLDGSRKLNAAIWKEDI